MAFAFWQVAAATRIHVVGNCVGENKLPGAHSTPSRCRPWPARWYRGRNPPRDT